MCKSTLETVSVLVQAVGMGGVPLIIVESSLFSLLGMDLLNLNPSSAGVKTDNTEFLLLTKNQPIGYNVINIYV